MCLIVRRWRQIPTPNNSKHSRVRSAFDHDKCLSNDRREGELGTGSTRHVQVTRKRMVHCLRAIMLRRKPCLPTANKWTKHAKCTNYYVFGNMVHRSLTALFDLGLAAMKFESGNASKREEDPDQQEQLSWHEVQGRRHARAKSMLHDEEMEVGLRTMAFTREGSRALATWFMRCSVGRMPDVCKGETPPICDLATPTSSPIVRIMQSLSSMVAGKPAFMELLWRSSDIDCFEAWREKHSAGRALQLRRVLLNMAAWTRRRHAFYQEFPFRLACLADHRVHFSAKQVAVDDFLKLPSCCQEPGMARTLREKPDLSAHGMLGPAFAKSIYHWSVSITCSVADTERKHARNRQFCRDKSISFAQFTSEFCNKELKETFNRGKARCPKPQPQPQQIPIAKELLAIVKARSAFEVVRDDFFARARCAGRKVQVQDPRMWKQIRDEFESLSVEALQYFDRLATSSAGVARAGRTARCSSSIAAAAILDEQQGPSAFATSSSSSSSLALVPLIAAQNSQVSFHQRGLQVQKASCWRGMWPAI